MPAAPNNHDAHDYAERIRKRLPRPKLGQRQRRLQTLTTAPFAAFTADKAIVFWRCERRLRRGLARVSAGWGGEALRVEPFVKQIHLLAAILGRGEDSGVGDVIQFLGGGAEQFCSEVTEVSYVGSS